MEIMPTVRTAGGSNVSVNTAILIVSSSLIQPVRVTRSPLLHFFLLFYSPLLLSMCGNIINKIAFMTFTLVKDKGINQKKSHKRETSAGIYEFIGAH